MPPTCGRESHRTVTVQASPKEVWGGFVVHYSNFGVSSSQSELGTRGQDVRFVWLYYSVSRLGWNRLS